MQLKRLVSINNLESKDIICCGSNRRYIKQFEEYTNGSCYIKAIASIDTNHPDKINLGENEVPCVSLPEIKRYKGNCSFVIMDDYYTEYYDILNEIDSDNTIDIVWWFADKETSIEIEYREKYDSFDLEDIIVFRSGPHASEYINGMDFSDNARALFEYLLSVNADKRYMMVWIVKNPDEYASKFNDRNVKFVSWEWACSEKPDLREEYYKYLCLAKYIFFTDAYGFTRNARKDQIRIQLWHGVGFKSRVNYVRCENRYEYKIDPGPVFAEKSIELYGLREDQVKILGYPKIDWLFEKDSRNILSLLGIQKTGKIILWAPTFRKTGGTLKELDMSDTCFEDSLPILDTDLKIREFNDLLAKKNMTLIIKMHPFQDEASFKDVCYSNIITLSSKKLYSYDIQMNQFLKYADALISDYSSTATEYMQLDRPIGFIINDQKAYGEERRFAFDPIEEWLPGEILNTYEDLVHFADEVYEGKDKSAEKRHGLFSQMHSFSGWGASERIAEEFGITKKEDDTNDSAI